MVAPVATINNQAVKVNQWALISPWLTYSDADGNPAVQYQFWDGGGSGDSGYFWTPTNEHWAAATAITVSAADVGNVYVRGGSNGAGGSETMYVRAFDGTSWGDWDAFTLTTQPNATPVVTVANHTLQVDQWAQVSTWLSYIDGNGEPAVQYEFFDGGTAADSGYFWTNDNAHWAAGTTITVNAADVGGVFVRGGSNLAGGSETLWARAYDGNQWGNWTSFTLTTAANVAPVAAIADHTLHINEWAQVSNWVSYSDGNGNAATRYQFWDSGTSADSGYFWTNGNEHWAANTVIDVAAADLNGIFVRGGANFGGSAETMWVRAFDGLQWGNWDSFTLTTQANARPVAAIADHTVFDNQWSQVSNWLSYSDADGEPATRYQFWDSGTGADSGYFWTNGNEHWAANTVIDLSAAELNGLFVRGGAAAGAETMWVRAFDGREWGNWDSFTLTTQLNTPPVATIANHNLAANQWAQVNTWLSYSDANGQPATMYEFWDGGVAANSGYFYSNASEHHAAETSITVMASNISSVWVRGGSAAGSEQMFVRAFDGIAWSNWDQFTLTTV